MMVMMMMNRWNKKSVVRLKQIHSLLSITSCQKRRIYSFNKWIAVLPACMSNDHHHLIIISRRGVLEELHGYLERHVTKASSHLVRSQLIHYHLIIMKSYHHHIIMKSCLECSASGYAILCSPLADNPLCT